MGKIKVNEIEKHDATEVTVNSNVVMAAGTSVSSPSISTDTISEKTSASGVTVDGVLLKDNSVNTDTISEKTSGSGVTIDGVLLKDSKIGGTITIPGSTGTMALTSDISAGGLESAQQWRLTATITTTGVNTITTNLATTTEEFLGNMGSLVSESSGIFSFSENGYYLLTVVHASNFTTNNAYGQIYVSATSDNFTTENRIGYQQSRGMANTLQTSSNTYILDVTDTVNQKIRFKTDITSGGQVAGSSGDNVTSFTFMKLGDT